MLVERYVELGKCQFCNIKKATWNYKRSTIFTSWNKMVCDSCKKNIQKYGPSVAEKMV